MMSDRPSFEKIHYMLRPRKQVERKIIIELLQELQTALQIELKEYQYLGLGAIYYYDFILFNKYLSITDMISLDDKPCARRFTFNLPFDFVRFENLSTSRFLNSQSATIEKSRLVWFDYDSRLILWSEPSTERFNVNRPILEDIEALTRKSRENDLFILTISLDTPRNAFATISTRHRFLSRFKSYLSSKYRSVDYITAENYRYINQNLLLNAFKNSETNQALKFRKLFSFAYSDSTPMYTLGGIYRSEDSEGVHLQSEFFQADEDGIMDIDVPLLTYREKLKLDQAILFFQKHLGCRTSDEDLAVAAKEKLGFEIDCLDLKNYIKYYRYYPQYYEGMI